MATPKARVEMYFVKQLEKGLIPSVSELAAVAKEEGYNYGTQKQLRNFKHKFLQLSKFVENRKPRLVSESSMYQTIALGSYGDYIFTDLADMGEKHRNFNSGKLFIKLYAIMRVLSNTGKLVSFTFSLCYSQGVPM